MAEIAHIVGYKKGSCRYRSDLPTHERHRFDNLILLCPTHHDLVDRVRCTRHTEEVMRTMKARQAQAHDPERHPYRGDLFDRIVVDLVGYAIDQGHFAPSEEDDEGSISGDLPTLTASATGSTSAHVVGNEAVDYERSRISVWSGAEATDEGLALLGGGEIASGASRPVVTVDEASMNVIVENVGDGDAMRVRVTPADGSEDAYRPAQDVADRLAPGERWRAGQYAPPGHSSSPHAVYLQWIDESSNKSQRAIFLLRT